MNCQIIKSSNRIKIGRKNYPVPNYIFTSERYQKLEPTTITLQSKICKLNETINSTADFESLIMSVSFWGAKVPDSIYNLSIDQTLSEYLSPNIKDKINENLYKQLDALVKFDIETIIRFFILTGCFSQIKYAIEKDISFDREMIEACFIKRRWDIFRLIYENCYISYTDVVETIIKFSSFGIIPFVKSKLPGQKNSPNELIYDGTERYPRVDIIDSELAVKFTVLFIDRLIFLDNLEAFNYYLSENKVTLNLSILAARYNSIKCLKFLAENHGFLDSKIYKTAIENGSLTCFEYLIEKKCPPCDFPVDVAIRSNQSEMFSYMMKNGFTFTENTFLEAVRLKNITLMAYLDRYKCVRTKECFEEAIKNSSKKCLRYMFKNGFTIPENPIEMALCHRKTRIVKFLTKRIKATKDNMIIAIAKNLYGCVRHFKNLGVKLTSTHMIAAVPNLKMLNLLKSYGLEVTNEVLVMAIKKNDLPSFQFAIENILDQIDMYVFELLCLGYDADIIFEHIFSGKIHPSTIIKKGGAGCFRVLFRNYQKTGKIGKDERKFDIRDMKLAIESNNFEVFKCMHQLGVDYTDEVYFYSIKHRRRDCSNYYINQMQIKPPNYSRESLEQRNR